MPLASIQPLQRLSLFEALAGQIEEWILSGDLEPGAKLPSEDSLGRQFGVSRPVVREALAQLRERGLIETVSGSGTYVKHPDADHLTDAVLRHLRMAAGGTESIAKVYEARLAIETTTARLAAERAGEHELEQIETLLDSMRSAGKDVERWTASDLGFHVAVARASHNPFLTTLLAPLVKVIEQTIKESFRSREAVRAGLRAHELIFARIVARDSAGSEQAMRAHLADSQRRLTASRGGQGRGRRR
ncbi:MAG TPA: FadR/GntR family transcriptional regulator [Gaiellaceae bacterium]|nr:FadR/GntR family transcriptional regulator [Gaiellaceae bacterium]